MDNQINSQKFEIRVKVSKPDIDVNGHVNNTVYLHWVQDAAVAHWIASATPEQQENIVWVVMRHEIDYKTALHLGEEIIARTWVGKATDLLFERHTEIIRGADSKIAALARTLWCPINKKTGRIMRVGEDVRSRFSIP